MIGFCSAEISAEMDLATVPLFPNEGPISISILTNIETALRILALDFVFIQIT